LISYDSEISEEQVSKILVDKTTKDEIFIDFGKLSNTVDNGKALYVPSDNNPITMHLVG
jgi:hypothetical protein